MRALATLALLAGCFDQQPADGSLKCHPNTARACPSGFYCAEDGTCWRNGHSPAIDLSLSGNADLARTLGSQGDGCTSDDECGTHHCVDGVCCESACDGQCQACNLDVPGACATVTSGSPRGARAACAGAGTSCAGSCNGASTSCAYPPASTICGAACDGHCDGAGSCSSASAGSCPNGFACGAGACLTSCGSDGDCQTNFHCAAPNCVRVPESDCLDGADNNGDGLADCADPTCNEQVQCVPDLPFGDQYGTLVPSPGGSCPTSLGSPQRVFRGLAPGAPCDGCFCRGTTNCSMNVYLSSTASCPNQTTSAGTITFTNLFGDPSQTPCVSFASQTVASVYFGAPSATNPGCALASGAQNAPPTWNEIQNFCVVTRNSSSCPAGQVCVPKPSPSPICLRIPNAAQACPSGYQAVTDDLYLGVSDNRVCSNCTCGAPTGSGTCHMYDASYYASNACGSGGQSIGSVDPPACYNITSASYSAVYGVGGVGFGPSCAAPTTSGTGSVTATSGSTICCPTCGCANPPCLSPICRKSQYCDGTGCQTCNTAKFCGAGCTDCTTQGGDTCQSGSRCVCGSLGSTCDATYADGCSAGACTCGSGPSCDASGPGIAQKEQCTGGQCTCGSTICDRRYSDRCNGTTCQCGASGSCNPAIADNCTNGACQCGSAPACVMSGSGTKACVAGQCQCNGTVCIGDSCDAASGCACGASVGCDPMKADHCQSGVCKCGGTNACTSGGKPFCKNGMCSS
jgi:hypothetical protein